MQNAKLRKQKQEFIRFIFDNYFGSDDERFTAVTEYSATQLKNWISGKKSPRKETLDYILHCRFAPDFQIVCEFKELDLEAATMTQLRKFLGNYSDEPGIYAFYDCRAQLLYIGKAVKLLREVHAALHGRADLVKFPSGIPNKTRKRWELVSYVSAYSVPSASHRDHPKHVESLMLRISKPPLNKQIGTLTKVAKPKKQDQ